ncbi:MAG TPA: hypothetical protein VF523_08695, partial [Burkholderiales bacterium]
LRDFTARVRATLANIAGLLGAAPDQDRIMALHMMFVGAAVLNVARDDANSRRECSEVARLAVETFMPADASARTRQRRKS